MASTVNAASTPTRSLKVLDQLFKRPTNRLILCFDGTGISFRGDSADSNIVKLYSKFEQSASNQKHYYQPGIGTDTLKGSELRPNLAKRLKSLISSTLDQAFATTFHKHVIAGYRFLMRYYEPGDRIYLFGFSRGAFTARFLARMVSQIGLLSKGNDELIPQAFRVYQDYELGVRAEETRAYMNSFQMTFCRHDHPEETNHRRKGGVKIYFLGLFDTINSVSIFEIPFQENTKVPEVYGTAQHIRHAVSVDERRVKLRAALLAQDVYAMDLKHKEDVKEVFFPGNHSDIGGGYMAISNSTLTTEQTSPQANKSDKKSKYIFQWLSKSSARTQNWPLQLSDVPLKWMIDELDKLPDDKIEWNQSKEEFLKNYREHSSDALHAKIHDDLSLGGGGVWCSVLLWNAQEYLPWARRLQYATSKWNQVRFPPNNGSPRDIPPGAVFHHSVLARLRDDADYRPANNVWPVGFSEPISLKNVFQQAGPDQKNYLDAYQVFFTVHEVHDPAAMQTVADGTYKVVAATVVGDGRPEGDVQRSKSVKDKVSAAASNRAAPEKQAASAAATGGVMGGLLGLAAVGGLKT